MVEWTGSNGQVLTGHSKLNVQDLDIISKLAFNRGFYDRAVEWMEAAIWKADKLETDEATLQRLRSTLKTMQNKHDQVSSIIIESLCITS